MINQLEPWKKNTSENMKSEDKQKYNDEYITKQPMFQLRKVVESFDQKQSEIQVEKTSDDSICIQVDTSRIKNSLIHLNYEHQKQLLSKIKEQTIKELFDLNNKFRMNEDKLGKNPMDLPSLKQSCGL